MQSSDTGGQIYIRGVGQEATKSSGEPPAATSVGRARGNLHAIGVAADPPAAPRIRDQKIMREPQRNRAARIQPRQLVVRKEHIGRRQIGPKLSERARTDYRCYITMDQPGECRPLRADSELIGHASSEFMMAVVGPSLSR